MTQGPHFILGHILDNLSSGYVTCTGEPEVWYSNPVVEDQWEQNVQQKRVFGTYMDAANSYSVVDVDASSFKRQLFEELEASASFPAEDNYPSVTILEGDQITSQAINAASGGVLVLRGVVVHIPYDAVFSGLLIVESSNVEIGGGDGPNLTGKMLLLAGEHAFDDTLRIAVFTGEVSPQVPFELEPRCCCEPTILGTSPSSGDWEVMDIFGGMQVDACPADEWRIIRTADQEVLHSGILRQENGELYLDGLPESLPTRVIEKVIDGPAHCNPPEEIEITGSIPSPDPVFWGGSWDSSYLGSGQISETGDVVWYGEVLTSYLVIWTVDDCFEWNMYYKSPTTNYQLQLGCKQPDGSIEWPE